MEEIHNIDHTVVLVQLIMNHNKRRLLFDKCGHLFLILVSSLSKCCIILSRDDFPFLKIPYEY